MQWFRWYRGTSENPKFRVAARNGDVTLLTVMGVWQVILEDAAHSDHRGVCEKCEQFIAAALDLPDDGTVEKALCGLESVNLISAGVGAITVRGWAKWQYEQDVKDPTNAERQKKHREKKRQESAPVTKRNGNVTACNTPDTDTDTEKEDYPSSPRGDARRFDEFWQQYPRKVGKKAAQRRFEAALRGGVDPADILSGLGRYVTKFSETALKPSSFAIRTLGSVRGGGWTRMCQHRSRKRHRKRRGWRYERERKIAG